MPVTILKFVLGPLENNSYLVLGEDLTCIIIDPAIGSQKMVEHIINEKLTPVAILLTHGHFDHIMGIPAIHKAFPSLSIYASHLELPLLTNPEYNGSPMLGKPFVIADPIVPITEGDVTIGSITFHAMPIPGHSPGGFAYLFGTHCVTGDSLFAGSIGRTDFPHCDQDALIHGIKTHLLTLPEETSVLPGHGGRSTIGREKRHNQYLQ